MTRWRASLADRLERDGYSAAVINPRFVKPLDREMLEALCAPRGCLRHF